MTTAADRTTLTVELGTRSYPIHIGPGLIGDAGELLKPVLRKPRAFVLTDANVAPLYLNPLLSSLERAGISAGHLILPAGEATKSFAHLEQVVEAMLEARIERSSTVVALGGGVIGDLAGFAAAIVLRGIDFVQIPTTLLAQVDSSVGGKTGIDTAHGKNLAGAFHQPRAVLADTDALSTLPQRERLAGYAEVCKYGLLGDAGFWDWLEKHGSEVVSGDRTALTHAIRISCEAKAAVVAADERESGRRALLNLGHTFGHALEAELGFSGELLHGEAVAIGMVMAFDVSVRLGLCPAEDADRIRRHFEATGLPTTPPVTANGQPLGATALIGHMAQDKKVQDGAITFVLARSIGDAFLTSDVDPAVINSVLEDALAA